MLSVKCSGNLAKRELFICKIMCVKNYSTVLDGGRSKRASALPS